MTLDESIRHCEEIAATNEKLCKRFHNAAQLQDYGKCADEHRQLAEWLKDYKRLKSAVEDIKAEINLLSDSEQIDLHTVEFTNWIGMRNKVLDIINKHIEGDRE